MTNQISERHHQAKELFAKAIELSGDERRKFLVGACGSDTDLLSEVESLLGFDSPDDDDDFGVFISGMTSFIRGRDAMPSSLRIGTRAIVAAVLLVGAGLFVFQFRQAVRNQVASSLRSICDVQSKAIQAWEAARLRETEQLGNSAPIQSLVSRLISVSEQDNPREALLASREVSEFYAASDAYTQAHDGAALYVVSRDGVILADTDPALLGRRINADAFAYIIPVFQGRTMVTPPVQDRAYVADPTVEVSKSISHSFAVVPVKKDNEVIAALASMEFAGKGHREILISGESEFITSVIDDKGRVVISSSGDDPAFPRRPTFSTGHRSLLTEVAAAAFGDAEQRSSSGEILRPYVNHHGQHVVGAWQWVPNSATGLIVEWAADEAYWPIRQMMLATVFCLTGLLGALCWEPVRVGIRRRRRHEGGWIEGRYRLQQTLGEGGASVVMRAGDTVLGRDVAIKILKRYHGSGRISATRFRREIEVLSNLRHPNTVRVFDAGILQTGEPYYVMELLDGVTLADLIERNGKLSEPDAIRLVVQVCSSLSEAHADGVIHRDIKPENVMVLNATSSEPHVTVLDFGMVKNANRLSKLTSSTEITGTLHFLAPETISDPQRVGPPADVYSTGALLFYLLTGKRLFDSQSAPKALHSIVNEPPDLSSLEAGDISESTRRVINSTLSKNPEERPKDARALKKILISSNSSEENQESTSHMSGESR